MQASTISKSPRTKKIKRMPRLQKLATQKKKYPKRQLGIPKKQGEEKKKKEHLPQKKIKRQVIFPKRM